MNRIITSLITMAVFFSLVGCANPDDPSTWNIEKTNKWFEKAEWLNGWSVKPDLSINRSSFAKVYFKNPERWDKVFIFLMDHDLEGLELKRYDLDGDNLFVLVSEYNTKNPEEINFEAHKKYIDLQYVPTGTELIGMATLDSRDSTLQKYDDAKDIEFFTVKKEKLVLATHKEFFIFFPEDAHKPGIENGNNSPVKKIVVKIRID